MRKILLSTAILLLSSTAANADSYTIRPLTKDRLVIEDKYGRTQGFVRPGFGDRLIVEDKYGRDEGLRIRRDEDEVEIETDEDDDDE